MKDEIYTDFEPPRFKKSGNSKKRWRLILIAIVLIAVLTTAYWAYEKYGLFGSTANSDKANEQMSTTVSVHFIDVGQGDAIFIELTDGRTMLIDAGPNDMGKTVLSYIKKLGYERIDYVLCTHPHEDHIGGMDTVIDALEIGTVYMPKIEYTTKTYSDVLESISQKGLTVETAKAGVEILKEDGLEITLLSPVRDDNTDLNDWSAVCKIKYNDTAFLFMGDASTENESEITGDVSADVIKIGHHGSSTSTSEQFLKRVNPQYAVISVAKDNDYGYPHYEITERLAAANVKVYRTDKNGTVIFTSNGTEITVKEVQ